VKLLISTIALTFSLVIAEELPTTKGLFLDLDANHGVEIEDENRVKAWKNKVTGNSADIFVKQDEGRNKQEKVKERVMGLGTGRPTLKKNIESIGGNSTLIFKEQELINHSEDAFDHMTHGSGYTWLSVMCVYEQVKGKPDVNSFFGNLTNGKPYAGFWGNITDDNRPWMGTRTGKDLSIKIKKGTKRNTWHPELNPLVVAPKPLTEKKYYLIMGRMGAGTDTVDLELFINNPSEPVDKKTVPIVTDTNPSKMAIGQERDATNHPGWESFHGEISRFLIFERPLTDEELSAIAKYLTKAYNLTN